jgi:hypothetical protein
MKRKDILSILIPLFIFVIAWIGFSVYHNIVNSTIPENLNVQIAAIPSSFDTTTIADLKNRQNVKPIYETSASVQSFIIPATPSASIATPTPTPTIAVVPISSGSAQQATTGGNLSQ